MLLWLGKQFHVFFSQNNDDTDFRAINSSIVLHRWADRELHLSDSLENTNPILRWCLSADSPEKTQKEVLRLFADYRERKLLDEEAQCAEALLHHVLGNPSKAKDSLPSGDNSSYTKLCAAIIYKKDLLPLIEESAYELRNRELHWWEIRALEQSFNKENAPEAITNSLFSNEKSQQIRAFNTWASIPYWLTLLLGLPLIRQFLKKESILPRDGYAFTIRYWPVLLVISVYFIGDFLNSKIANFVSYRADQTLGEDIGVITFDLIFRLFNAILLLAVFLPALKLIKPIFGLQRNIAWKLILGALSLDFIASLLISEITSALGPIDYPSFLSTTEDGWKGLALSLFASVLLAPLAEEIVFRGFLFRSMRNWAPFLLSGMISGIIFSVVHYYDLSGSLTLISFALISSWLYQRTGNILNCIIFHALVNLIIIAPSWLLYHYGY